MKVLNVGRWFVTQLPKLNVIRVLSYWRVLLPARRDRAPVNAEEIVMLVVSHLRVDPRVEREARALVKAGYRVVVIYPDAYEPFYHEQPIDWGPGIRFRPLTAGAGGFSLQFPWLLGSEMHEAACQEKPFAFHCHDLNTCLIGLSAARKSNSYCVCDFHEWYSENVSWDQAISGWGPHPRLKRILFKIAEFVVLRRADAVVTVCDSIADELSGWKTFGRRPVKVVRNIPTLEFVGGNDSSLRQELGIAEKDFLLLWQGGIGPSRLIEPIIEALRFVPNVTLVIRGPAIEIFGAAYEELAERIGIKDRVVLLPPVPSAQVVQAARGVDAGIWSLPNLCKNFYYSLPNKIFEYLAADLPVLAARFPEAAKLVEGNEVGLCFDPYDPESIAKQIQKMASNREILGRFRANIPAALDRLDAGKEWNKLVAIYEELNGRHIGKNNDGEVPHGIIQSKK